MLNLEMNKKQSLLLKEELECLIECKYDSLQDYTDNTEEERILMLIHMYQQLCSRLEVQESTTRIYQDCKLHFGIK